MEKIISGNIKWRESDLSSMPDGEYIILNEIGQGWGLPTKDITPEDLRKVADHLEQMRAKQ